jgi:tRNA uridine 5-carbamoylmethylation protein Kti12
MSLQTSNDFSFQGIGDAGKSTFMKQLKLLHKKGFTEAEIERYKRIIHDNVLTNMKQLLEHAQRSKVKLPTKLQVLQTSGDGSILFCLTNSSITSFGKEFNRSSD